MQTDNVVNDVIVLNVTAKREDAADHPLRADVTRCECGNPLGADSEDGVCADCVRIIEAFVASLDESPVITPLGTFVVGAAAISVVVIFWALIIWLIAVYV